MKQFKPLIFAVCAALLCVQMAFSQTARKQPILTGKITTASGSPAPFLTVKLLASKVAVSTNADGFFEIKNAAVLTDTLVVEGISIKRLAQPVALKANEPSQLALTVEESAWGMSEVVVSASRNRETFDEVPSSVSIVGLKTMEKNIQITSNLGDILENRVPGLAPSNGLSSNSGQTLRGRSMLIMVDGVPQSTPLRNGAMDLRALDPSVIERVEVVKGATAIYGNGAAGGLINYFTRNPQSDKLLNSQTAVGLTGSLVSSANSMGGRVSQLFYGGKKKFNYVVSGVYEQTGEQKDADGDVLPPVYGLGETNSYNAFAKVGYQFNDNHKVQLSYNYYSSRQKTNYITVNGDYVKGEKTTAALGTNKGVPQGVRGNHNLSLQFSGLTQLANTHYDVDLYYQSVDNVFFYSTAFVDGGVSRILSKKNGLRFVFNTPVQTGILKANFSYGFDMQTDVTSQPLVDGRTWVPKMKMFNLAPFAQTKINLGKYLVLKGGARLERVNIGVDDYSTLPSVNAQTGAVTPSIDVKGGDLNYESVVFNAGLRYNLSEFFSPYLSFSQGFSVSDIGVVLRAARVNDIAKINTEAIIVDNYEVGFVSKFKNIRFEATGYISKSDLGVNNRYDNGVYNVVRSPEKIYGFELAAEVKVNRNIQTGASYTYVEGKMDADNNGKFDDDTDRYLPGNRISAPKLTGFVDYAVVPEKFNVMFQYTGVLSRNRFDRNNAGSYNPFLGPVNPYHLVNALFGYHLNKSTSVNLGIENLLNENYFTARSQWGANNDSYAKGKGASYRLTLNVKL